MHTLGRRLFVSSALVACVLVGAGRDASAQPNVSYAGQRLGHTQSGEELRCVRELGTGYEDRMQAIAVARMGAVEAVVVKGRDAKWHALATNANAYGGLSSAADNMDVRALFPLSSPKGIASSRAGGVNEAFMAYVLGLETKDIKTNIYSSGRAAGVVNVTTNLGDNLGMHGAVGHADEGFVLGAPTAIELRRSLFEGGDPRLAAGVLFHERSHLADYEMAQRWATAFTREARHEFMRDKAQQGVFVQWIFAQQKARRISADEAQTVIDIAAGVHGSTEARAYISTFIAATQAGAYDVARDQLLTYARGISGPRPRIAGPGGDAIESALRQDLGEAYRGLDPNGKKQFDAAFTAAKSAAPTAWISKAH